jgi:hypothetical protein
MTDWLRKSTSLWACVSIFSAVLSSLGGCNADQCIRHSDCPTAQVCVGGSCVAPGDDDASPIPSGPANDAGPTDGSPQSSDTDLADATSR